MQLGRVFLCSAKHSKRLNALKVPDARWIYVMLHVHADVNGNFTADAHELFSEIFAKIHTEAHIKEALDEMEKVGLITRYHNGECLHINNYDKTPGLRNDRHSPRYPAFDKSSKPIIPHSHPDKPVTATINPASEATAFRKWFEVKHSELRKKPVFTSDKDDAKISAVYETFKDWSLLRKTAIKFLEGNDFADDKASYSIGVWASQINFLMDCIHTPAAKPAPAPTNEKVNTPKTSDIWTYILDTHESHTGEGVEPSLEQVKVVKRKIEAQGEDAVRKSIKKYYDTGGDSLAACIKNI